jgi:hypothetical protein
MASAFGRVVMPIRKCLLHAPLDLAAPNFACVRMTLDPGVWGDSLGELPILSPGFADRSPGRDKAIVERKLYYFDLASQIIAGEQQTR